ncbi:MAG: restriction endonuclease [Planctomycetes bacterium]|nr:restriction endonuclease [Planctomycetota bacterium]
MIELTVESLQTEARAFAEIESIHAEPALFGVTDGKAVGTYFEQKFRAFLSAKYSFRGGNSAKGIDFPELLVDVKVTSIRQPQSSCPFKSARQKIYGLGYALLVFVYEKKDDPATVTGTLNVLHTIFVEAERTADYQTTLGVRQILDNDGNTDDLVAYFQDRHLPVDEIEARNLAEEVLSSPPEIGYLTISNALQWRLQYSRVISKAGDIDGILRIR